MLGSLARARGWRKSRVGRERVVESGGPLAEVSGAGRGRPLLLVGVMDSAFTQGTLAKPRNTSKNRKEICVHSCQD